MKTTKGLTKKAMVLVTGASLIALTMSAGTVLAAGADSEGVWGKPIAVQKLDNGVEKRYYKLQNTQDAGVRCIVYKDGQAVDQMITPTLPAAPAAKAEAKSLLSASGAGTQSVAEVESVWGKASSVRKLANGTEERYYSYGNTQNPGNRVFLFKDGKVVASGVANAPAAPAAKAEAKSVLSASGAGTQSVAEVESVWGKASSVKTLANGAEERYYSYGNTQNPGKRVFLFKDGKVVADGIAH